MEERQEEICDETDNSESLRQRVTTPRPAAPVNEVQPQRATMNSSDGYRNLIIWILVAAIAILVYRRLFLI